MSTVVLGLHIEQLRIVPGNGIPATCAERRQAVNERMAGYWPHVGLSKTIVSSSAVPQANFSSTGGLVMIVP